MELEEPYIVGTPVAAPNDEGSRYRDPLADALPPSTQPWRPSLSHAGTADDHAAGHLAGYHRAAYRSEQRARTAHGHRLYIPAVAPETAGATTTTIGNCVHDMGDLRGSSNPRAFARLRETSAAAARQSPLGRFRGGSSSGRATPAPHTSSSQQQQSYDGKANMPPMLPGSDRSYASSSSSLSSLTVPSTSSLAGMSSMMEGGSAWARLRGFPVPTTVPVIAVSGYRFVDRGEGNARCRGPTQVLERSSLHAHCGSSAQRGMCDGGCGQRMGPAGGGPARAKPRHPKQEQRHHCETHRHHRRPNRDDSGRNTHRKDVSGKDSGSLTALLATVHAAMESVFALLRRVAAAQRARENLTDSVRALLTVLDEAEAVVAARTQAFLRAANVRALRALNAGNFTGALVTLARAEAVAAPHAGHVFRYLPTAQELADFQRAQREGVDNHHDGGSGADSTNLQVQTTFETVPGPSMTPTSYSTQTASALAVWEMAVPYFTSSHEEDRCSAAAALDNNYALYHFSLGEFTAARERLARAVEMESALGPARVPTMGVTFMNLAQTLWELRQRKEAIAALERCEEVVERQVLEAKSRLSNLRAARAQRGKTSGLASATKASPGVAAANTPSTAEPRMPRQLPASVVSSHASSQSGRPLTRSASRSGWPGSSDSVSVSSSGSSSSNRGGEEHQQQHQRRPQSASFDSDAEASFYRLLVQYGHRRSSLSAGSVYSDTRASEAGGTTDDSDSSSLEPQNLYSSSRDKRHHRSHNNKHRKDELCGRDRLLTSEERALVAAWLAWRESVCLLSRALEQHARWLETMHDYRPAVVHYDLSLRWQKAIPRLDRAEQRRVDALQAALSGCKRQVRRRAAEEAVYHRSIRSPRGVTPTMTMSNCTNGGGRPISASSTGTRGLRVRSTVVTTLLPRRVEIIDETRTHHPRPYPCAPTPPAGLAGGLAPSVPRHMRRNKEDGIVGGCGKENASGVQAPVLVYSHPLSTAPTSSGAAPARGHHRVGRGGRACCLGDKNNRGQGTALAAFSPYCPTPSASHAQRPPMPWRSERRVGTSGRGSGSGIEANAKATAAAPANPTMANTSQRGRSSWAVTRRLPRGGPTGPEEKVEEKQVTTPPKRRTPSTSSVKPKRTASAMAPTMCRDPAVSVAPAAANTGAKTYDCDVNAAPQVENPQQKPKPVNGRDLLLQTLPMHTISATTTGDAGSLTRTAAPVFFPAQEPETTIPYASASVSAGPSDVSVSTVHETLDGPLASLHTPLRRTEGMLVDGGVHDDSQRTDNKSGSSRSKSWCTRLCGSSPDSNDDVKICVHTGDIEGVKDAIPAEAPPCIDILTTTECNLGVNSNDSSDDIVEVVAMLTQSSRATTNRSSFSSPLSEEVTVDIETTGEAEATAVDATVNEAPTDGNTTAGTTLSLAPWAETQPPTADGSLADMGKHSPSGEEGEMEESAADVVSKMEASAVRTVDRAHSRQVQGDGAGNESDRGTRGEGSKSTSSSTSESDISASCSSGSSTPPPDPELEAATTAALLNMIEKRLFSNSPSASRSSQVESPMSDRVGSHSHNISSSNGNCSPYVRRELKGYERMLEEEERKGAASLSVLLTPTHPVPSPLVPGAPTSPCVAQETLMTAAAVVADTTTVVAAPILPDGAIVPALPPNEPIDPNKSEGEAAPSLATATTDAYLPMSPALLAVAVTARPPTLNAPLCPLEEGELPVSPPLVDVSTALTSSSSIASSLGGPSPPPRGYHQSRDAAVDTAPLPREWGHDHQQHQHQQHEHEQHHLHQHQPPQQGSGVDSVVTTSTATSRRRRNRVFVYVLANRQVGSQTVPMTNTAVPNLATDAPAVAVYSHALPAMRGHEKPPWPAQHVQAARPPLNDETRAVLDADAPWHSPEPMHRQQGPTEEHHATNPWLLTAPNTESAPQSQQQHQPYAQSHEYHFPQAGRDALPWASAVPPAMANPRYYSEMPSNGRQEAARTDAVAVRSGASPMPHRPTTATTTHPLCVRGPADRARSPSEDTLIVCQGSIDEIVATEEEDDVQGHSHSHRHAQSHFIADGDASCDIGAPQAAAVPHFRPHRHVRSNSFDNGGVNGNASGGGMDGAMNSNTSYPKSVLTTYASQPTLDAITAPYMRTPTSHTIGHSSSGDEGGGGLCLFRDSERGTSASGDATDPSNNTDRRESSPVMTSHNTVAATTAAQREQVTRQLIHKNGITDTMAGTFDEQWQLEMKGDRPDLSIDELVVKSIQRDMLQLEAAQLIQQEWRRRRRRLAL